MNGRFHVVLFGAALFAALCTRVCAQAPIPNGQRVPIAAETPSPNELLIDAARRLQSYPVAPDVVYTIIWQIRDKNVFDTGSYDSNGVSYPSDPYAARNPDARIPYFAEDKPLDYVARYGWRASDGMENWSNATSAAKHDKLPFARFFPQFLGPFAWSLRIATMMGSTNHGLSRPDLEALKSIATVIATAKPVYAVTLSGIEQIESHRVYHLRLRPLTNPQMHNLRELWVDAQTFDLWRARFTGFYADSPTEITTDLIPVDAYRIIGHMAWSYSTMGTSYDCSTETGEIVFLPALPDWIFNQTLYNRRYEAGEPDLLGEYLDQAQTVTPLPAQFMNH